MLNKQFIIRPIGVIHTPYIDEVPRGRKTSLEKSDDFWIEIAPELVTGLDKLELFNYIQVLFYLDRNEGNTQLVAHPPKLNGNQVGVFASRSPFRPNHIALSSVRLFEIAGNKLFISPIDAFDNTAVIDIKPYIRSHDLREDANKGWEDYFNQDNS